ncbi:hypothetical protein WJX81_001498 [Elliptochloris bilobata]|uniref:Uncharacterized protein n=1 Tax=Elliptochloris bilobata TaxID=381761 RepID=A0AAW1QJ08_9CHLO
MGRRSHRTRHAPANAAERRSAGIDVLLDEAAGVALASVLWCRDVVMVYLPGLVPARFRSLLMRMLFLDPSPTSFFTQGEAFGEAEAGALRLMSGRVVADEDLLTNVTVLGMMSSPLDPVDALGIVEALLRRTVAQAAAGRGVVPAAAAVYYKQLPVAVLELAEYVPPAAPLPPADLAAPRKLARAGDWWAALRFAEGDTAAAAEMRAYMARRGAEWNPPPGGVVRLAPGAPPRAVPDEFTDELFAMDDKYGLGAALRACREPDLLAGRGAVSPGTTLKTSTPAQKEDGRGDGSDMAWLDALAKLNPRGELLAALLPNLAAATAHDEDPTVLGAYLRCLHAHGAAAGAPALAPSALAALLLRRTLTANALLSAPGVSGMPGSAADALGILLAAFECNRSAAAWPEDQETVAVVRSGGGAGDGVKDGNGEGPGGAAELILPLDVRGAAAAARCPDARLSTAGVRALSPAGLLRLCAGLGLPRAALRPLLAALDALPAEQVLVGLRGKDGPPAAPLAAACRACQALADRHGLIRGDGERPGDNFLRVLAATAPEAAATPIKLGMLGGGAPSLRLQGADTGTAAGPAAAPAAAAAGSGTRAASAAIGAGRPRPKSERPPIEPGGAARALTQRLLREPPETLRPAVAEAIAAALAPPGRRSSAGAAAELVGACAAALGTLARLGGTSTAIGSTANKAEVLLRRDAAVAVALTVDPDLRLPASQALATQPLRSALWGSRQLLVRLYLAAPESVLAALLARAANQPGCPATVQQQQGQRLAAPAAPAAEPSAAAAAAAAMGLAARHPALVAAQLERLAAWAAPAAAAVGEAGLQPGERGAAAHALQRVAALLGALLPLLLDRALPENRAAAAAEGVVDPFDVAPPLPGDGPMLHPSGWAAGFAAVAETLLGALGGVAPAAAAAVYELVAAGAEQPAVLAAPGVAGSLLAATGLPDGGARECAFGLLASLAASDPLAAGAAPIGPCLLARLRGGDAKAAADAAAAVPALLPACGLYAPHVISVLLAHGAAGALPQWRAGASGL